MRYCRVSTALCRCIYIYRGCPPRPEAVLDGLLNCRIAFSTNGQPRARRKRWKDIAGIAMIAGTIAIVAGGLVYAGHNDNERRVYELMHESELCHAHHHRLACLSIEDELRQRSEHFWSQRRAMSSLAL